MRHVFEGETLLVTITYEKVVPGTCRHKKVSETVERKRANGRIQYLSILVGTVRNIKVV